MPFFKTWEEEQEWLALEGLEVTSEPLNQRAAEA
jgi:hypothetical protein